MSAKQHAPVTIRSIGGITLLAFAIAVLVGGGNFIGVRFSNAELPPFWGAALRFGLASVLFCFVAVGMRASWPKGKQLALTAAYGTLGFALFFALVYWALMRVTASVATIVLASVPLTTLLLAAAQRLEALRLRNVLGAVLAFAGIAWMVVGPQHLEIPLDALAAIVAAAVCAGQGLIIGKRLSSNHPAVTNAIGMAVGCVLLLVMSVVRGESWQLPQTPQATWAIVYLVTLGSVGLFALMLFVVARWTASATAYMFVLFPIATMALGSLLGDERFTLQAAVGAALVMGGCWFGALSTGARTTTPSSTANLRVSR